MTNEGKQTLGVVAFLAAGLTGAATFMYGMDSAMRGFSTLPGLKAAGAKMLGAGVLPKLVGTKFAAAAIAAGGTTGLRVLLPAVAVSLAFSTAGYFLTISGSPKRNDASLSPAQPTTDARFQ